MALTTTQDGLLTVAEVAKIADMSRQAVEGHIATGRIAPAVIAGRLRLFSRASVALWIQERKRQGVTKRGPQAKKNGHPKVGKR
jgi:predicted DNA-binding transcriptional regulator AlpA